MKTPSCILALLIVFGVAACPAADVSELTKETQKSVNENKKFTLVWWIPTEFWSLALKDDKNITDAQRTDFFTALDKYTIVVVVTGDFGPMAAFQAKSRTDIIQNSELRVNDKVLPVLAAADISQSAVNFIAMMKPLMANMLGNFGQGMEFLLYSNEQKGAKMLAATKPGGLTYTIYGKTFAWHLPLGSLLPPEIDPATKEQFPGNYLFNPYTGSKLTPLKAVPDA